MPRNAEIAKNALPLIADSAVQCAGGADLVLRFHQIVAIEGDMLDVGGNRVQIAVASILALLAMKGYTIANRLKRKDAYDIYCCVRYFPGGVDALVTATMPLLDVETVRAGYQSKGPTCSESVPPINGSRTPSDRWTFGSPGWA